MNTSYLARTLATVLSVLVPIAGHGDTGTRGPANPWVYLDLYRSLMTRVTASAR